MKVEQDMRLRNKLQNYCICKKGKQWQGLGNPWKKNGYIVSKRRGCIIMSLTSGEI